ncbi:MAG: hypothetical protein K8F91_15510 [Candidatus Obscuribacterales bacterium]|nr:hypothetical protein [Candidatus Obscuribacterales bacterium]
MWAFPLAIVLVFRLGPDSFQTAESPVRANSRLVAQSILPPAPDAPGGGNPLQGLGRPDDTGPSRMDQFKPPGTIDTSEPVEPESQLPGSGKPEAGLTNGKETSKTLPRPATSDLPPVAPEPKMQNPAPNLPTRPQTPLGNALSDIDHKQYASALTKLQDLKRAEPENLKTRYLLAITFVYLRQNQKARRQYQFVLEHSTDPHLSEFARAGLLKIMSETNHSPK